jgi:myo-inositol-1(or 4)-monophosphatase
MVCDFAGGNNHMKSGNIVAASPKVLQAMVKDMRPHLSETLAK